MKLTLLSAMETETIPVIGDEPHPFVDKVQDEEFAEICTSIDRLNDVVERIEAETVITPALAQEAMQFPELRPALEDEEKKPEEQKKGVLRRAFDAVVEAIQKIFAAILAVVRGVVKWLLGVGNARKRGLKETLVKEYEELLMIIKGGGKVKIFNLLGPTIRADKLDEKYGNRITPAQRDIIDQGPASMEIYAAAKLLEGAGDPGERLSKLSDKLNQTYRELAMEANQMDDARNKSAMEADYAMVVGSSSKSESSSGDPGMDKFKIDIEKRFEKAYEEAGEIPTVFVKAVETAREAQANLKQDAYTFDSKNLAAVQYSLEVAVKSGRFARVARTMSHSFEHSIKKTEKGMEQADKGFSAFTKKHDKTLGVDAIMAVNRSYMKVLQRFMHDVKTIGQIFGVVEFGFNNASEALITFCSMLVEASDTFLRDHPELQGNISTFMLDVKLKISRLRGDQTAKVA